MDKKQATRVLNLTADLLELVGENDFKVMAYRKAERMLDRFDGDWDEAVTHGFKKVPGIGAQLGASLTEFAATGSFPPLDEVAAAIPPGVLDLFRVRGLGPKRIRALWDAGIDSLPALQGSARDGRLARLKGFGAATQARLLEEVEFALKSQERRHAPVALAVLDALQAQLEGVAVVDAAGSARRGLETIGDLDAVATGDRAAVLDALTPYHAAPHPEFPWAVRAEIEGVSVDVAVVDANARGAALAVMTGSKAFVNERVLPAVAARGLKLTSAGLFDGDTLIPTPEEADVFARLDLEAVIPEWREPEHMHLAPGALPDPRALVRAEQLRGMLHVHTTWSDGAESVHAMAAAARDLGMTYLGVCDHSQAAFYANGLTPDRVRAQWQEIDAVNDSIDGIRVLKGIECDILADGRLDFDDELLEGFDFVVASVHSSFNQAPADQTARLVRAVTHPLVTILGHPTGRLLLRRPPYRFDVDAVLEAALERGTVIEINANPYRLDLDWRDALRWRDRGLRFAINTDAHRSDGYHDLRYGVAAARKAALTTAHIVNTLSADDFAALAAARREGRTTS